VIALIIVCIALEFAGEPAREWLRYERAALEAGQWWRVLSAHLVHLGPTHAALNVAGLALVAWLFSDELRLIDWLGGGLSVAGCITAGLYWLSPEVIWYVGLSGVLHGWFALGAARTWPTAPGIATAMLLALAVKITIEQLSGTLAFTQALAIGPVVVDAHLYGGIGGILGYVILRWRHPGGRSPL
jgi:rhomboid family GlyGly-CTERM serine protease